MTVASPLEWVYMAYLRKLQPKLAGSRERSLLIVGISAPTPIDENAPEREQWRGVLQYYGGRRERTGEHSVVGAETLWPLLGPALDDERFVDSRGCDHSSQELTLLGLTLDEPNLTAWQRYRQRQSREAGSSADVGESLGGPNGIDLERHQRVGQVRIDRLLGTTHSRRRPVVHGERRQNRAQLGTSVGSQAIAAGKLPNLPVRPPLVAGKVFGIAGPHVTDASAYMGIDLVGQHALNDGQHIFCQRDPPGHPLEVGTTAVVIGPIQAPTWEKAFNPRENG